MRNIVVVFISALAAISSPTLAQSYFPNIQVSDFPDPVIDTQEAAPEQNPALNTIVTPRAQNGSLIFKASPNVRKKLIDKMVLEQRKKDPRGAKELERLFASSDIIGQIDAMMRPMGLRADNVADAYTLWWIIAWHAANEKNGEPDARTMAAVKSQAESALLRTPQIAAATEAQKQELAEGLLIQATLIDAAMETFKGDKKQITALARAVNQGAKAMNENMDLTKMTLTEDGFVPRSGGRSDASDGAGDDQLAANDSGTAADDASLGHYALYAAAGTGLLAGVFALGKGLSKRG